MPLLFSDLTFSDLTKGAKGLAYDNNSIHINLNDAVKVHSERQYHLKLI